MTPTHDMAVALLTPIWQGIPTDYKAKYKFTIWRQFEDQARSAAYTTTLSHFLSRICSRLNVSIHDAGTRDVLAVVASGHDRDVLRVLRDESAYVVTMIRVANEEKRAKRV